MESQGLKVSFRDILVAAGVSKIRLPVGSPRPSRCVDTVLDAVEKGDWGRAAGVFYGGSEAFRQVPATVIGSLLQITDAGLATHFDFGHCQQQGQVEIVEVLTYLGKEKPAFPLGRTTWTFQEFALGWVVMEVS